MIISTARKISQIEIQSSVAVFEEWGLKVGFGQNLFHAYNQFAGSSEERTADLQKALDDPECEAIICARGGYGTVQIIDRLDFTEFSKKPKWIVGYSDVTVLHTHLQQLIGCESIHGIMPINFPEGGSTNSSLESLKNVLFGRLPNYTFKSVHHLNRYGSAKAELVGGNLSILYSLTGTKSSLNTKGKILFIEDLDEYLYHIDRMMMNLKRSGMLENLAGLLIGGMSNMNDNLVPYGMDAEEIIRENIKDYDFPVGFGFPAGHLDENYALILGRKAEFAVNGEMIKLNYI